MAHVKTTTAASIPDDFKARVREHVRVSGTPVDDAVLQGYAAGAIEDFEKYTGMAVFPQTRILYAASWEEACDLMSGPVQAVSSVKYKDADGAEATLPSTNYFTSLTGEVGKLVFKSDYTLPDLEEDNPDPIYIEFTAGFGEVDSETVADIPNLMLAGILLYAGELYDKREVDWKGVGQSAAHWTDLLRDRFFNRYRLNF